MGDAIRVILTWTSQNQTSMKYKRGTIDYLARPLAATKKVIFSLL
jgi:hypothetical protein